MIYYIKDYILFLISLFVSVSCVGQKSNYVEKEFVKYEITSPRLDSLIDAFVYKERACFDFDESLSVLIYNYNIKSSDTNGIIFSIESKETVINEDITGFIAVKDYPIFLDKETSGLVFFQSLEHKEQLSLSQKEVDVNYLTREEDTLYLIDGQNRPYMARWFLKYYDKQISLFRQDHCQLRERKEMIDSLIDAGWHYPKFKE